jgi:hypothetical protein
MEGLKTERVSELAPPPIEVLCPKDNTPAPRTPKKTAAKQHQAQEWRRRGGHRPQRSRLIWNISGKSSKKCNLIADKRIK